MKHHWWPVSYRLGISPAGPLVASLLLFSVCVLAVSGALAGGFKIIEQSARGTALAGAQVATLRDPTSVVVNPSALATLEGTHFSFGATVIVPDQKFTGVLPDRNETKMQTQVIFPPNISLTHTFGHSWGLGLTVNVPYAAKTEWDGEWVGKRLVTKSDFRLVTFTPSVGVNITDNIALGAGVHVHIPRILLEQKIPSPAGGSSSADATATYEANGGPQVGFQLGLLAQPVHGLVLGASLSTSTKLSLSDGSVVYRGTADTSLPGGKFSTRLLAPAKIQGGIGWDPLAWLHAEINGEYTFWSDMKSVDVYYFEPIAPTKSLAQNWTNTLNLRCGVEIEFNEFSLRGGFRVERTPIPDEVLTPALPDANARAYCIGVGYEVAEGLLMDFAYESVVYEDRVVTTSSLEYAGAGTHFNGIYASRSAAVAVNVRYSWK